MLTPIFDSHTHSENSPDGRHTLSRMCETACDKGLMGFAITDHCDFNQFEEENFQNRCFLSRYHAKKSRVGFAGQIKLITGVEIGQPLEVPDISEPFIDRYAEEYDFTSARCTTTSAGKIFIFWITTPFPPGSCGSCWRNTSPR